MSAILLAARVHALAAKAHLLAARLHLTHLNDAADVATRLGHDLSALADEITSDGPPVGTG